MAADIEFFSGIASVSPSLLKSSICEQMSAHASFLAALLKPGFFLGRLPFSRLRRTELPEFWGLLDFIRYGFLESRVSGVSSNGFKSINL
jgi:hypothetical protein